MISTTRGKFSLTSIIFLAAGLASCGERDDDLLTRGSQVMIEGESYCDELQKTFNIVVDEHISLTPRQRSPLYARVMSDLIDEDREIDSIVSSSQFEEMQRDLGSSIDEQGASLLDDSCSGLKALAFYRQSRVNEELDKEYSPYAEGFREVQKAYDNFEDGDSQGVLIYTYYQFLYFLGQNLDVYSRYESTGFEFTPMTFSLRTNAGVLAQYGVSDPDQYGGLKILAIDDRLETIRVGDRIKRLDFSSPVSGYQEGPKSFDLEAIQPSDFRKIEEILSEGPFRKLKIEVERTNADGDRIRVTAERNSIPSFLKTSGPSVYAELVDGILYARLIEFSAGSAQELSEKIDELKDHAEEIQGIVLDLRDNPGGSLLEMQRIAGLFVESMLIGYTQVRSSTHRDSFVSTYPLYSDSLSRPHEEPLVILINSQSASASEILATALKSSGRALVAGERSFGKHIGQSLINFGDVGNFKGRFWLTKSKYFDSNGDSLQGIGLKPNEGAGVTDLQVKRMRDNCIGENCDRLRLEDFSDKRSAGFLQPIEGESIDVSLIDFSEIGVEAQPLPDHLKYEYPSMTLQNALTHTVESEDTPKDFAVQVLKNRAQPEDELLGATDAGQMNALPSTPGNSPREVVRRIP